MCCIVQLDYNYQGNWLVMKTERIYWPVSNWAKSCKDSSNLFWQNMSNANRFWILSLRFAFSCSGSTTMSWLENKEWFTKETTTAQQHTHFITKTFLIYYIIIIKTKKKVTMLRIIKNRASLGVGYYAMLFARNVYRGNCNTIKDLINAHSRINAVSNKRPPWGVKFVLDTSL